MPTSPAGPSGLRVTASASREAGAVARPGSGSPGAPHPAARAARSACLGLGIAFLGLALGFGALYLRERLEVARFTNAADRGITGGDSARVVRFVEYANSNIATADFDGAAGPLVRAYYRLNPMHPGPGDVVRWGADTRGSCGSLSRVVHVMLGQRGIASRFLFLTDESGRTLHTVLEVRVHDRWIVIDPSYGIVYRHPDGSFVTAAELHADRVLLQRHVAAVRDYDPRYDYHATTHLNWKKVPVLLPGLRAGLVALLGEARVRDIGRPEVWIWPRLLASVACLALAAGCLLAYRVLGRATAARP